MAEKELEQWRIEVAEEKGRTKRQIEEIEDELFILIKRRLERRMTVENTKITAKAAECYFWVSQRFERGDKSPNVDQIRAIKEILFDVAKHWAKEADTAEEVEALAAVSHAIREMPVIWY